MSAGLRAYSAAMSVLHPALLAASRLRGGPEAAARAGHVDAEPRGALWAHASSVGELGGVAAFRDALRAHPAALRVTCQTRTGLSAARERMGLVADLAPWDTPSAVRARLARTQPAALLVFETELWPVLLRESAARIPVAWVNGRIGRRTLESAGRLRPLLGDGLARVAAFAVQDAGDARGFQALGARPERIRVVGNLKHDRPAPAAVQRADLGLREEGPVLIFGSVRDGEAQAVVDAFASTAAKHADCCAVFAPRKPEFVPPLEAALRAAGLDFGRRSEGARDCRVLVLDTLGELAGAYTLAHASFVGGSLVPSGGHDVMEPARAGSPVLFGPHTENCAADAEALLAAGAARRVPAAAELSASLAQLLSSVEPRAGMAAAARGVAEASRGAAARAVEWLERWGVVPAAGPVP